MSDLIRMSAEQMRRKGMINADEATSYMMQHYSQLAQAENHLSKADNQPAGAENQHAEAENHLIEAEKELAELNSSVKNISYPKPLLPQITVPFNGNRPELEKVKFPSLPYSIYNGAYKNLQQAETTERELQINAIDSYVVPVKVKGNLAKSLYGVSEEGTWYRVLIGHYRSKEEAREKLGLLMEKRPDDLPEIMKFNYAVECGRFLEQKAADKVLSELELEGFLPYTQTYPISKGNALTRVLVGCFFSSKGAQPEKSNLTQHGFSCKIEQR